MTNKENHNVTHHYECQRPILTIIIFFISYPVLEWCFPFSGDPFKKRYRFNAFRVLINWYMFSKIFINLCLSFSIFSSTVYFISFIEICMWPISYGKWFIIIMSNLVVLFPFYTFTDIALLCWGIKTWLIIYPLNGNAYNKNISLKYRNKGRV